MEFEKEINLVEKVRNFLFEKEDEKNELGQ